MPDPLSYDVALIVSQSAVNEIAGQVYATKPDLFKGHVAGSVQGQSYAVDYKVIAPPQFDLSPGSAHMVRQRELAHTELQALARLPGARPGVNQVIQSLQARLDDVPTSAFAILNKIGLWVSLGNNPPGAELDFNATIAATIGTGAGGKIVIQASSVDLVPAQQNGPPIDPFTMSLIDQYVKPSFLGVVNGLLGGLEPPALTLPGLSLSAPVCAVISGTLVACATLLNADGAAASLTSVPTVSGMGVLISPRGLQTATVEGVHALVGPKPIKGSGHSGGDGFDAHYDYDLEFGEPAAVLSGSTVHLTLPLSGGAHAGITFMWVPFDVGYSAYASPTPEFDIQPQVVDGELWITLPRMKTVAVVLVPSGTVSSVIIGALSWLVVEPIVAAVAAIATSVINDISFPVIAVPPIKVALAGFTVAATPINVGLTEYGTSALLSGDIKLSAADGAAAPEALAAVAGPPAGAPITPERILWPGAASGETASGGIYFAGNFEPCGTGTITSLSDSAVTLTGSFNVDMELDGQHVTAAGTFEAGAARTASGSWNVTFVAHTTDGRDVNFQSDFQGDWVDGNPTFTGIVDVGGPLPVQVGFYVQTDQQGVAYVYAYPQITGPRGQVLPTAYARFPVPSTATR